MKKFKVEKRLRAALVEDIRTSKGDLLHKGAMLYLEILQNGSLKVWSEDVPPTFVNAKSIVVIYPEVIKPKKK